MAFDQDTYSSLPPLPTNRRRLPPSEQHQQLALDLVSGRVQGTIVVQSPLHVGTGLLVEAPRGTRTTSPLVKQFYRLDNHRTIPGSSLKGSLRSLIELFTNACLPHERRGEHQGCSKTNVCVACKLFGSMGYEGNVYFAAATQLDDKVSVTTVPAQFNRKKHRDNRRFYPHRIKQTENATWALETVPKGGQFALNVTFRNLQSAEVGLLLIALGQGDPAICPKLGGAKSAGLGAVRFVDVAAERKVIGQSYRQLDSVYEPLDVAACLESAETLVNAAHLRDVQARMKL